MPDVPELVALLYQADPARLSLSATVSSRQDPAVDRQVHGFAADELNQVLGPLPKPWRVREDPYPGYGWSERRYRILLAPGQRYRVEGDDGSATAVSNGESRWHILAGAARRWPADDGPYQEFRDMVAPRWLIASYDLHVTGAAVADGRSAYRVTATPRAVPIQSDSRRYHLLDRVDVLIDAELGIILRSEQVFRGQTLTVTELHDLAIDPPRAADRRLFEPPPGMPVDDRPVFGTFSPQGPGWRAVITAADATASVMASAVRHAPSWPSGRRASDDHAEMPQDADDFAAVMRSLEPLGDELVNLLHRTDLPAQDFDAELHQWLDAGTAFGAMDTVRSVLPQPFDGILGPDALWDAIGERGRRNGTVHATARLRVSMPGRYRIDYLTGNWRTKCRAMACDGEHTMKLFADRVASGPARPLERRFATLVDPAWQLNDWALSAGGETSVDGRRGLRIVAEERGWPARVGLGQVFSPVESIVDAELGIVLRQTSYVDGRPAIRYELRNVTAPAGPEDFRIDLAPGLRAVTDTGGLLADRDLPTPLKAVGTAAGLAAGGAIAGAVAVTGWLQKRRARPEPRDRG